jgi:hypothetical protein
VPFCARQLFGNLRSRTSAGQVTARELVQLDRLTPGRRTVVPLSLNAIREEGTA